MIRWYGSRTRRRRKVNDIFVWWFDGGLRFGELDKEVQKGVGA
jgi:hypothetical protein